VTSLAAEQLSVDRVRDISGYLAGWVRAFGKPLGTTEADWLLRRDTELFGLFDAGGRIVAGIGLRRGVARVGTDNVSIRFVHDVWVLPERQRQGLIGRLASTAVGQVEAAGTQATVGLLSAKRYLADALLRAGFAERQAPLVLRGPAQELNGRLDAGVRLTERVGDLGYAGVAQLVNGVYASDGRAYVVRSETYLARRFDESPRRYLVAGIYPGSGRHLSGVVIAKPWPRKWCVHVLVAAVQAAEYLSPLLRAVATVVLAEMPGCTMDIVQDAARPISAGLLASGFQPEAGRHRFVVRTRLPAFGREWLLQRDELNSY
jgi:GNAT superfamily N-acetyltransferase